MNYSKKGLPWVFKGVTDVTACETSEEVINKANLNWKVDKCPLKADISTINGYNDPIVEGYYATYRTDTKVPLGIVKGKYTPVQNIDAFGFFDRAIEDNNAEWFTAGCLGNGESIFISAKLPNIINVKGDIVENYLIFTNTHDGTGGVKILLSPIRLICFNMLNYAFKQRTSYISYKHTMNVQSKIDMSTEILGITKEKIDEYAELCNVLVRKKITIEQNNEFIVKFVLSDKEKVDLMESGYSYKDIINRRWNAMDIANISTRKVNMIQEMINYSEYGIGQQEIAGTAWGTLNAITGYYSNVDNNSGESRMNTLIYGDRANKIKKATEQLISL